MHNHEPQNYNCPFCRIVERAKLHDVQSSDIIYHSQSVIAFLGLGRRANNPINVLVVPNAHFEHIYDLPIEFVPDIHTLARAVAIAMKAVYQCDGVSTRQHNEPAGDQDVWHYHVHITPRFSGDNFYSSEIISLPENERHEHAERLREYMLEHIPELFPV